MSSWRDHPQYIKSVPIGDPNTVAAFRPGPPVRLISPAVLANLRTILQAEGK